MGNKGNILMLNGAPSDPNAAQFKAGAHSVLDGSGSGNSANVAAGIIASWSGWDEFFAGTIDAVGVNPRGQWRCAQSAERALQLFRIAAVGKLLCVTGNRGQRGA